MITKKHIQNGLVFCLIAGAFVLAFFLLFEKDEMEQMTQASREARKNPFLAAERFLAQSDIPVTSTADRDILINPPPTGHMIFVNRLGGNLPAEREDNLISWMEHGGTLVITLHKLWNKNSEKSGNTLLDRLGIRRYSASDIEAETEEDEEATDSDNDDLADNEKTHDQVEDTEENPFDKKQKKFFDDFYDTETVTVYFDDETSATIECIADRILEDVDETPLAVHSGESGAHIIVKAVGQGRLIVLSDNDWLRNEKIGKNDHAYVWGNMAAGHGKIWILYTSLSPSFFMTIMDKAPFVMVSLLTLCLLFLLWLTRSIGPRYRMIDYKHRNISEHLLAAGFFTMKQASGLALIHPTRSLVGKNLKTRHLFFTKKTREEQVDYLAQWTGLKPDEIRAAFNGPADKKDVFIAASASLQKITQDVLVKEKT